VGRRRPKGTGGISVDPGTGKADVDLKLKNWDGTTTRYRKRLPSKETAERYAVRIRYEHERNMAPFRDGESERLLLSEYLKEWLSGIEGTIARHTFRDYHDKVRLHISPVLGRVRVLDLTREHLQRLYRQKLEEGLSPRSVRYIHVTLSKALYDAEGSGLVPKNVARFAKPPKDIHLEKPVMSVAEAMLFLEAIRGDPLEALYLLAVTTGLRRGEMLGLKWTDLDLEAGTLKVSRSLDTQYGPTQEVAPKRQSSRRAARLPAPVVEALSRHREAQKGRRAALGPLWKGPEIEEGYVFTTRIGTPTHPQNILRRSLKPLMERAGLPSYNFQTLRRSNATFLVLLGIHPRTAMAWLGHSDVSTTMRIYQQAPDELQDRAAELMGELLFPPKSEG
jgi:integrase